MNVKCTRTADDPRWVGLNGIEGNRVRRQEIARSMCSGCDVIDWCRREALELQDFGVVRGGYALGDSRRGDVLRTYNLMRVDLGIPEVDYGLDDNEEPDYLQRAFDARKAGWPHVCEMCSKATRPKFQAQKYWPGTITTYNADGTMCATCSKRVKREEDGNRAE